MENTNIYYQKLKSLFKGLQAQNIDKFLKEAELHDYYEYGKTYYNLFVEKIEDLKAKNKKLKENQINVRKLIKSLGSPIHTNEYILKPDDKGEWWITHKHVGSGEPFEQFLTDKPVKDKLNFKVDPQTGLHY